MENSTHTPRNPFVNLKSSQFDFASFANSVRHEQKKQMNRLVELIFIHNKWATDEMFMFDQWNENKMNELTIDIDEKRFTFTNEDGNKVSLIDWLQENAEIRNASDKSITIMSLTPKHVNMIGIS